MPDVREVYEMITKQKAPDPGALERQQKRQVRAARNRKFGAFAVAATIGVAAVATFLGTRGEQNPTRPAAEPSTGDRATTAPFYVPGAASTPFFLDLQTGKRTPLAGRLVGGYSYVASPDGRRVAYSSSAGGGCQTGGVTVANIDGTGVRTLEPPEGLTYCGPRWSPDSTKLVYQERNGASEDDVGNLFVQDVSSGRRTQITDLKLTRAWWFFLSPSFSPDGRKVIFHLPRSSSETTGWDVWSVPATGGEPTSKFPTMWLRNASFPILNPAGGPEGGAIAFVSPMHNDLAGQSIMTGRPIPNSDIRRTLVEAKSSIWWPTFSPDGRRIAYQDGGSIYVVHVGTGESTKVADGSTTEWLDDDTLIVAP